jgi:cytochrome c-type biogenesis protein CcmH
VSRVVLLLVAAFASPAWAQTSDLEREARQLEAMLIAPCCFSQQVSLHQSEAASEVKRDIRHRLAAGETRQQILDAYTAQYGKRILVEPPAEGFDRVLYVLPPLGLILTAALTVVLVRRFAARGALAPPAPAPAGPPDAAYSAALDDELRDLD